jgi:hypothetical protein
MQMKKTDKAADVYAHNKTKLPYHRLNAVLPVLLFTTIFLTGCSENYSNGERIGLITQFSNTGIIWKSWEGELHVTQTGMNSTMKDFDFSIDNDHEDPAVINQIDSAAQHGWKVKLTYHETFGKNWFKNRGETDHFITNVEILDKNPVSNLLGKPDSSLRGHIIDTIYVVIDRSKEK